jgi:hypothetical protein
MPSYEQERRKNFLWKVKKMKIQITRGMKGGKNFRAIEIDGKYNSGYIQSRTVTGTTDETGLNFLR